MKNRKLKFIKIGPGAIVTAAFIGPGTITTCSFAGARFGYALLWGLVFSIIATIVLQEMTARLGIVTRQGLGEALRKQFTGKITGLLTAALVISAIAIGNAAFQTGNILGASLGLEALSGSGSRFLKAWILLIGAIAFFLLFAGNYKIIEKILVALVILMSLTFFSTAIILLPHLSRLLSGIFIPSVPSGSVLTLIGLIGTTVVPYNLFLHASAVQERWKDASDLKEARLDLSVSVILGGLISMAIVVTSATAFFNTGKSLTNISELAVQLDPLLGKWAKYCTGLGFFAAGITSSITAPLAAAYAVQGTLGWESGLKSWKVRLVWISILLFGIVFSLAGFKPLEAIVFAQAANGILLPVIAIYLLSVMNNHAIMGTQRNKLLSNIAGILVVLVASGLGLRSLLDVFGII